MFERMEFGADESISFFGVKPLLSQEGGKKFLPILWSSFYRVGTLYND